MGGDYTGEWLRSLRRRNLAETTIRRRRMSVYRLEGWCAPWPVHQATQDMVEAWLDSLRVSPQSRGHYLSDVAAFYRWLVRRGVRRDDPTELVERPKRPHYLPRPLSGHDLTMAMRLAPPKIRVTLALAALAGLRAGEVATLDATDLDRRSLTIHVRQGKGNKDRVVPISSLLDSELSLYGVPRLGPVVPTEDGRNYKAGSVSSIVGKYLRSVGVDASLHCCRHFFATEAYAGSNDIRAVQELLGHASPQTTSVYTRIGSAQTRAAVECVKLPDGAPLHDFA